MKFYVCTNYLWILVSFSLRALINKNRAERLLYLNVIGFNISILIILKINNPFAFMIAATFFIISICSTIRVNVISYTLKKLDEEI